MTVAGSAPPVKGPRRRRPAADMRAQVVEAARELLRTEGPHAITLKAVALRAGVTHGNVTYHFGTVEALHAALITAIIEDLAASAAIAAGHLRAGEIGARDVVDVVFAAMIAGGAGRLVAWLAATGAGHRLAPLYEIIAGLVGGLAMGEAGKRAGGTDAVGSLVAAIFIPALGASLIGADLEATLGLPQGCVRQFVADGLARERDARGLNAPSETPVLDRPPCPAPR